MAAPAVFHKRRATTAQSPEAVLLEEALDKVEISIAIGQNEVKKNLLGSLHGMLDVLPGGNLGAKTAKLLRENKQFKELLGVLGDLENFPGFSPKQYVFLLRWAAKLGVKYPKEGSLEPVEQKFFDAYFAKFHGDRPAVYAKMKFGAQAAVLCAAVDVEYPLNRLSAFAGSLSNRFARLGSTAENCSLENVLDYCRYIEGSEANPNRRYGLMTSALPGFRLWMHKKETTKTDLNEHEYNQLAKIAIIFSRIAERGEPLILSQAELLQRGFPHLTPAVKVELLERSQGKNTEILKLAQQYFLKNGLQKYGKELRGRLVKVFGHAEGEKFADVIQKIENAPITGREPEKYDDDALLDIGVDIADVRASMGAEFSNLLSEVRSGTVSLGKLNRKPEVHMGNGTTDFFDFMLMDGTVRVALILRENQEQVAEKDLVTLQNAGMFLLEIGPGAVYRYSRLPNDERPNWLAYRVAAVQSEAKYLYLD